MAITTVSRNRRRLASISGVLLAAILCPEAAIAQAGFSVTVLPIGSGHANVGRSVVMSDDATTVLGGGLWTQAGGYVPPAPGATDHTINYPLALSGDGKTVVGDVYDYGTGIHQAVTFDSSMSPVPMSLPANVSDSTAYAVSQDGSVIAGWWHSSADAYARTFRWTAADGLIDLGRAPDGHAPQPMAISDDGRTILGSTGSATYLWTEETGFESIGSFPTHPGGQVTAWDMSGDGDTVVGYVFGAPRLPQITAFRWTRDGGFTGLGDTFGVIETQAYAVSDDGRVVVGSTGRGATERAMVWDPDNGMRDLATILAANGFDWGDSHLYRATDISADGQTILVDNLLIHLPVAINLLPVPEPASLALLPLAALALRRRTRPGRP